MHHIEKTAAIHHFPIKISLQKNLTTLGCATADYGPETSNHCRLLRRALQRRNIDVCVDVVGVDEEAPNGRNDRD